MSDVKFEVVPEAGEGSKFSEDRAVVYKRLQSELVQQAKVGDVRPLSSYWVLM